VTSNDPITSVALAFVAMDEPGAKPASVSSAEHLGLAYLAAALRARGIRTQITNAELEGLSIAGVVERILNSGAQVVGFSPVSLSMKQTLDTLAQLKMRRPRIRSVLGGHLASMCATDILGSEPFVDMIVRGDSETTFPNLLENLSAGGDLATVPGLSWRQDGEVRESPTPTTLTDLNSVLAPARDDLQLLKKQGRLRGARILASRGCLYNCSFCTTPGFYGRSVRFRSPELVVREMDELAGEFGISHFWFNDDLFVNGTPENTHWIEEFTGLVKGRNYSFRVLCRADSFRERNRHLLSLLKDTGLVHVFLGLESGTQESLSLYSKGTSVERNREAVALLKRSGIAVQIGFIIFNPYSTPDEIKANAHFLHEIGELYRFFPLTLPMSVFPGTSVAHRLKSDGLLDRVDYREPLACFRYVNEEVAHLVTFMRDFYENYNEIDAHILSAIGYEANAEAATVRRELADINLHYFIAIIDHFVRGVKANTVADTWVDSIQNCLDRNGVSGRKSRNPHLTVETH
jgi:anaerobic magnesium-protoporphyrin IX monomethyl ester cyclase